MTPKYDRISKDLSYHFSCINWSVWLFLMCFQCDEWSKLSNLKDWNLSNFKKKTTDWQQDFS